MSHIVNFFKVNGRDHVEIKVVGDPNSVIQKVTDKHKQRFPREWAAYESGDGSVDYGGTPLTELDAGEGRRVSHSFAASMSIKGVHNVEELAVLSDAQAKALGMGVLTLREKARKLVEERNDAVLAEAIARMQAEREAQEQPSGDGAPEPKADAPKAATGRAKVRN